MASRIRLTIALPADAAVSALLDLPASPSACYVFAHGAGAGMEHPFMASIAQGLAEHGVATLRFQFPFMEQGSKRVDPPKVAQAAVRAAVDEAARRLPGVPLFAGGKSFGARMTSQAQAGLPLACVRGLVFVGFPLHPAGKPATERGQHLADVGVPMLFLQGTRDALAALELVRTTASELGPRATLHVVDGADHAFHVVLRSGRNNAQVCEELLGTMVAWMAATLSRRA
ncbi:MAG: alpha/beta hydrolase [Ramlibacter sp.]|jgi:predicted alpha/beta-hydrolase family hydrolase|uniref:alpha/beta hydrolase family protein n=1 Tax=Ramlibacter sp. TaxID=1917967 RepID=UPI00263869BD|nr:alpha/beta family hydrolase [Ramlibacter sp.]MDB5752922.1 alpha/beta hydrolase [Ramlibacter sp.]